MNELVAMNATYRPRPFEAVNFVPLAAASDRAACSVRDRHGG